MRGARWHQVRRPKPQERWESPWQQLPRRQEAPAALSSALGERGGKQDSEATDIGSQPGVPGAELGGERGWGQGKSPLQLTSLEKQGLRLVGTALQQALHLYTPCSHLPPPPCVLGPGTPEMTAGGSWLTMRPSDKKAPSFVAAGDPPGTCETSGDVHGSPSCGFCSLEPPNLSLPVSLQSHPLYLCNASDDDNLEPGFISIVKLESPQRAPRPCLSLASKVDSHLTPAHPEPLRAQLWTTRGPVLFVCLFPESGVLSSGFYNP